MYGGTHGHPFPNLWMPSNLNPLRACPCSDDLRDGLRDLADVAGHLGDVTARPEVLVVQAASEAFGDDHAVGQDSQRHQANSDEHGLFSLVHGSAPPPAGSTHFRVPVRDCDDVGCVGKIDVQA